MASIFDKLFNKKPVEEVHIPTEYELQSKVLSFGRLADNYIKMCENNIEKHTLKAVQYKTQGSPFAKNEISRIVALQKNINTANGYKETMEHFFDDYQNGKFNVEFISSMNDFTASMKTAVDNMKQIDMNDFMNTMLSTNSSMDAMQEQLDSVMNVFDTLNAPASAQFSDAEAQVDALINQTLADIAMETEDVSVDNIAKHITSKIIA